MITWQDAEVTFPEIEVAIGSEVQSELKPLTTTIQSIKAFRLKVESHIETFISEAGQVVWNGLHPKRPSPLHVYKLPEIRAIVNGRMVCHFSSYRVEAALLDLDRWRVPSTTTDATPSVISETCAKAIEAQEVEITLKDTGTVIKCFIKRRPSSWGWTLLLTETMLSFELGREIRVKYGSFLHTALWRVSAYGWSDTSEVDPRTVATLVNLGLVNTGYKVTPQGAGVLTELSEVDPTTTPSLLMLFAGTLLGTQREDTPIFQFAQDNQYVHDKLDDPEVLEKGKGWLEENCLRILSHSNCSDARRLKLISYTPMSHLSELLASDDEKIREAAQHRAAYLKAIGEN